ncbi:hypothetical protein B0J13DRAFT_446879, partial [Dactylonectria estremocensis]
TCYSTQIEVVLQGSLTRQEILDTLDTEHSPDLQYATALLETAMTGVLPNGTNTVTQAIDATTLLNYWHMNVLGNLPRAGASNSVRTPNDYFMDRFGSTGNREPLLLAERNMNQVKARQRIQQNREQLLQATLRISSAVPQLARLHQIHQEFDFDWYRTRTSTARDWVTSQLDQISAAYLSVSPQRPDYQVVTAAVASFRNELGYMLPPPEDTKKY